MFCRQLVDKMSIFFRFVNYLLVNSKIIIHLYFQVSLKKYSFMDLFNWSQLLIVFYILLSFLKSLFPQFISKVHLQTLFISIPSQESCFHSLIIQSPCVLLNFSFLLSNASFCLDRNFYWLSFMDWQPTRPAAFDSEYTCYFNFKVDQNLLSFIVAYESAWM